MKTANKTGSSIVYFLTSVVLSCTAVILIHYYIPFVKQTAGTYNIAMLLGDPLRDFLIKALLLIAGIRAFLTFFVKSKKAPKGKKNISVLYDWNGCSVDYFTIFVSLYNQQIYR